MNPERWTAMSHFCLCPFCDVSHWTESQIWIGTPCREMFTKPQYGEDGCYLKRLQMQSTWH